MAYFALSQEAEKEEAQNGLGQLTQKNEQMKKDCHCCTINFDSGFVRTVLVTSSDTEEDKQCGTIVHIIED
jgi:hypothetical protein